MSEATAALPPVEPKKWSIPSCKLSPDELRVVRECNRDSFYQRSLPIGVGLGLVTYLGIRSGFLRPNRRFGAIPKVILAVVVGYFAGKASYRSEYKERIMQLPNSRLAEMYKKREGFGFQSWELRSLMAGVPLGGGDASTEATGDQVPANDPEKLRE